MAGRQNARQHGRGNPISLEHRLIPGERLEVHELGATCIRYVGHVFAALRSACEIPYEPRVDRSEEGVAGLGFLSGARHVVEQPSQLQSAEVARERQARAGAKTVLAAVARIGCDKLVGPGVLPYEGIVERRAGCAVPEDRRFALIRDADRLDVTARSAGIIDGLGYHLPGVSPDLIGIVLDPTGLRKDLLVLLLRNRHDLAGLAEKDETRARRALIDGAYVLTHDRLPPSFQTFTPDGRAGARWQMLRCLEYPDTFE